MIQPRKFAGVQFVPINFVNQQSQGKQSSDDCRSIFCSALNSTLQSRERTFLPKNLSFSNFKVRTDAPPAVLPSTADPSEIARSSLGSEEQESGSGAFQCNENVCDDDDCLANRCCKDANMTEAA